ncbi:hypothetical protein GGP41_010596 [Bipolaris sorokiniana]|uniref:MARVEL domain-containing protein n=2 Tax=Cochliobolus sativus TaxID=45130 RepID=A0A8H5ZIN5_COCSA|nr:uncharacterized protein COCSADRAFT_140041 [Bipolaris sorokiniana ND90Pr]EMD65733.1 hypothetical protein COCSADRAFT_140041 [Bipolaris sorokiniana ND90Pr]KAF5850946.1 hypothetical protein GGP41_010596 [Bipolaris sorokiniana]
MVSSILNVALRGVQALFGIIVLGLSVTLIRGHHWGSLPAGLGYGAFVGGLSFVAAFIGLAATWFDFLGGMVGLVIDGVVALLNLAGGVLYVVKLAGVDCELSAEDPGNLKKMAENEWFNGGCHGSGFCWNNYKYGKNLSKAIAVYEGHCKEAKADTVFMFLTAVVMIVCALLVWLRMRRGY